MARIGVIGLGTMGAALALNIAENGFPIAVWNRKTQVTRDFHEEAGPLADKVEARYTDGILRILVQRREASRPRQIKVK